MPELSETILHLWLYKEKSSFFDLLFSSEDSNNFSFKKLVVETINTSLSYRKSEVSNYLSKSTPSTTINKKNMVPKKEEGIPLVIEFLDYLQSLIPSEVSKSWIRMCAYLEV